MRYCVTTLTVLCVVSGWRPAAAQTRPPAPNKELEALQAHFELVIERRFNGLFQGITTVPQWEARKKQVRTALERMLWHDVKLPEGPPPAQITHRVERPGYTIENLVIETAPKLYLTANLYLPRSGPRPFPVILYQCGHANKRNYARHGVWFASHGIAALVMDNIEMGEAEFTHHGVAAHAWFHWYSRGFSPLAVELLNARRAVDYLVARKDLDPKRIGATGRSGGGMTTFFLAALDERIAASAPVSGTLSTRGWVRQRLSVAHCDCQYPVNSHGLMYEEIGALIAPRAHLEVNADADRGFPMDAFTEMVGKMREIYRLYNADGALGMAVTPGGHADVEAIRLPVFSFFLKEFLGQKTPLTSEGPIEEIAAEELVCHRRGFPVDERLTRIDEALIPAQWGTARLPGAAAAERRRKELAEIVKKQVFAYFPDRAAPLEPAWEEPVEMQGRTARKVSFTSFEGLRVKGIYSLPAGTGATARFPALVVVDHRRGIPVWGNEQPIERNQWGDRAVLIVETLDTGSRALEQNLRSFSDNDPLHHMRRQAMICGTTLESMQVYEVLRSLELVRTLPNVDPGRITIIGKGEAGVNGMYAALLDGGVDRVVLQSPPASHRQGPHYLGILRHTDIPELAALFGERLRVGGEAPPQLDTAPRCASLIECLN